MNVSTRFAADVDTHDPVEFFTGVVEAHGFVMDWRGSVRRRFVARFTGVRKGAAVEVFETLDYADGGQDVRTWRIAPQGARQWSAEAGDLVEPAVIALGEQVGEARWTYRMDIAVKGRTLRLNLEDIMVQLSGDHMVSYTPIRKFGLKVGAIATQYRRLS